MTVPYSSTAKLTLKSCPIFWGHSQGSFQIGSAAGAPHICSSSAMPSASPYETGTLSRRDGLAAAPAPVSRGGEARRR